MSERKGIRRREFLLATVAGAGWATLGRRLGAAQAPAAPKTPRRPNILFIISDEHNARVTGCYGNRTVRTPHLDSLAADGVAFECAYTNSPLCVPARLAFTSGKYISRTGGWNNNCWLPSPEYPSIARAMTAAGYESFLCGKMHYDATCRYGFTEIGGNMNRSHMSGRGGRRRPDDLAARPGLSDRFDQFHPGDGPGMKHDLAVAAGQSSFWPIANAATSRSFSCADSSRRTFR